MRASAALLALCASVVHAEGPRAVDFQAALSAALLHSPLVLRAAAEQQEARAQVEALRAGTLPRVSVNGAVTRLDSDRVLGERVLVPATSVNGNVTASVPVLHAQAWLQVSRARRGWPPRRPRARRRGEGWPGRSPTPTSAWC